MVGVGVCVGTATCFTVPVDPRVFVLVAAQLQPFLDTHADECSLMHVALSRAVVCAKLP